VTAYRNQEEALRARVEQLEEEVSRLRGEQRLSPDATRRYVKHQTVALGIFALLGTLAALPCAGGFYYAGTEARGEVRELREVGHLGWEHVLLESVETAPDTIVEDPDGYLYPSEFLVVSDEAPNVVFYCGHRCAGSSTGEALRSGEPVDVSGYAERTSSFYAVSDATMDELLYVAGVQDRETVRVIEVRHDETWPLWFAMFWLLGMSLTLWLGLAFHVVRSRRDPDLPRDEDFARRDPGVVAILTFVTCGLYGIWWDYQYTSSLRRVTGRRDLLPLVDLLLTVATFGLWRLWARYRNAGAIDAAMRERLGWQHQDVRSHVVLGYLLSMICGIAALWIPYRLQEAYNVLIATQDD